MPPLLLKSFLTPLVQAIKEVRLGNVIARSKANLTKYDAVDLHLAENGGIILVEMMTSFPTNVLSN